MRVSKSSPSRSGDKNTVFLPEVDVSADMDAIDRGDAIVDKERATAWVSGRLGGFHTDRGTAYPVRGGDECELVRALAATRAGEDQYMKIGSNVFIASILPTDILRAAYAVAYRVPESRVAVLPDPLESWPDADVVLERFGGDILPGDYPTQVQPWGPDDRTDSRDITRSLSIALGIPVLALSERDDDDFELYLPDGAIHRVAVTQDDDGGLRNTPAMRLRISAARSARPPARAA